MPYSDEDLDDLKAELRKPRPYRCHDGLCGAGDCARCGDGEADEDEDDEDDE